MRRRMRRRSRAESTKPRRRNAPAAKRRRRVETIRGVISSASKEELQFALLRRKLSEARRHQRHAEEALRKTQPQLRQIIDTVPEAKIYTAEPPGWSKFLD